jgi:hypothetical protein
MTPYLAARGRALSIGPNGQVQARPAQSGLGSLFLTLPTRVLTGRQVSSCTQ